MRSVLAFLPLLILSSCEGVKITESPDVFFPPEMSGPMRELQAFPGAWWNYVVAMRPTRELCAAMKADPQLSRVGCQYGPADLKNLLDPWLLDLPLRVPPPTKDELFDRMNLALAKASAPLGGEIVDVLRADPLGTYEDLLALMQALNPLRLDYKKGFLRFADSDAAAIPVLLGFPREQTDSTEALRARLEAACAGRCGELFFIGPHFGTAKNKAVIKSDMKKVTLAGTILFALFLAALALTGRWRALFTVAPVAVGVWAAGLAVGWWAGGSIHGLTVAFGSGLAGMAMDYALHAFVQSSGPRIWWANFLGLLTTLAVFVVMAFSLIPLVREIMLFGLVGMGLAYLIFWLVLPRISEAHYLKPFPVGPVETRAAPLLLALVASSLLASFAFLRPDFSVRSLDQAGPRERQVAQDLFRSGGGEPPVVRLHDPKEAEDPEVELLKERAFAKASGITLVNRLTFLPPKEEQARNLAAWKERVCAEVVLPAKQRGSRPLKRPVKARGFSAELSETYSRFFQPFLEIASCERIEALAPKESGPYSSAIEADGRWLSTFFPRNAEEASAVRKAFPSAFSLRDLVELFPRRLSREMSWMAPLCLLLVLLIVLSAYRRPAFVVAVFLPWLTGAAFTLPALAWSASGFGFVSLVGQLMVFGMATDYGIFCVNYYLTVVASGQEGRRGIWTAILFSGVVTITGFLPLLFAEHVVLRQLGETLCLGTLGTVAGTVLIAPWWMKRALAV